MEELGEGLKDLKEIGTPQEGQQSQLAWTFDCITNQRAGMGWTKTFCIYVADEQLGLHAGRSMSGAGKVPKSVTCQNLMPCYCSWFPLPRSKRSISIYDNTMHFRNRTHRPLR